MLRAKWISLSLLVCLFAIIIGSTNAEAGPFRRFKERRQATACATAPSATLTIPFAKVGPDALTLAKVRSASLKAKALATAPKKATTNAVPVQISLNAGVLSITASPGGALAEITGTPANISVYWVGIATGLSNTQTFGPVNSIQFFGATDTGAFNEYLNFTAVSDSAVFAGANVENIFYGCFGGGLSSSVTTSASCFNEIVTMSATTSVTVIGSTPTGAVIPYYSGGTVNLTPSNLASNPNWYVYQN
jgi:hypothetical protein